MSQPLTVALPIELSMDVAVWIALVVVAAGLVFTAFLVVLALGPHLSDSWADRLGAAADANDAALEPQESD